ncbi:MAG: alpha/beta fold hydrolase [Planctomycetota bacterium]
MSPLYLHRSGEGPAALFVHGFPLDHSMWSAQIEALSDVATCLAVDLCGFGRSPWDGSEALTMERHADDLVRVLDASGVERADIIALSMGGYASLAMWERHPTRIRSMALVDTRAAADDAAGRSARDAAAARLRAGERDGWTSDSIPKLVGPGASDSVHSSIRAMIDSTPVETIVAALVGMRDRADRTETLATIDVPTLVLCGEDDALTPPAMSREMAGHLPDSRLEIIPGAGHMAPMEAPEAVNAALRSFLLERR